MSTHQSHEPWVDRDVEKLIKLWKLGKTTREIGIALHRPRNSIVSKAQRLQAVGLIQSRGSPILRKGQGRHLMSKSMAIIGHGKNGSVRLISRPTPKPTNPSAPSKLPTFADPSIKGKPFGEQGRFECVWPLWDNDTPRDQRCVCARPALPTRSYCSAHYERTLPKKSAVDTTKSSV